MSCLRVSEDAESFSTQNFFENGRTRLRCYEVHGEPRRFRNRALEPRRWPSRAGRKAPINRTHKPFALTPESADHALAFGVRASSAPLSQGMLRFDGVHGKGIRGAVLCMLRSPQSGLFYLRS